MAATKWITGAITSNPTCRSYTYNPIYITILRVPPYINYQETVWGFKVLARPPTLAQWHGGGIWKIPREGRIRFCSPKVWNQTYCWPNTPVGASNIGQTVFFTTKKPAASPMTKTPAGLTLLLWRRFRLSRPSASSRWKDDWIRRCGIQ